LLLPYVLQAIFSLKMPEILLYVGVVIGVLMLFRTYVNGARCKSKEKLHGKTVIVTGKTRIFNNIISLLRMCQDNLFVSRLKHFMGTL